MAKQLKERKRGDGCEDLIEDPTDYVGSMKRTMKRKKARKKEEPEKND